MPMMSYLNGNLLIICHSAHFIHSRGLYTILNIPKGAKHRFRNNGDQTARMLFFFAPAGIEKLFDEFAEMDEPASDLKSVIESLSELGKKYGVEYLVE